MWDEHQAGQKGETEPKQGIGSSVTNTNHKIDVTQPPLVPISTAIRQPKASTIASRTTGEGAGEGAMAWKRVGKQKAIPKKRRKSCQKYNKEKVNRRTKSVDAMCKMDSF